MEMIRTIIWTWWPLGTIADVVPLMDENRVIVKYGLEKVNKRLRPGIQMP